MCRVENGEGLGIPTETLCREAQREAEWSAGLRLCRVLRVPSSFFRGLASVAIPRLFDISSWLSLRGKARGKST